MAVPSWVDCTTRTARSPRFPDMTCALKVAISPSVTERTVLVYPITIAATHRKRVMLVHHVTILNMISGP